MNTTTSNDDANAIQVIYEWEFADYSSSTISVPEGKYITVSDPLTLEEREMLLDMADELLEMADAESAWGDPSPVTVRSIECSPGQWQCAVDAARFDLAARILIERAMAGMPS